MTETNVPERGKYVDGVFVPERLRDSQWKSSDVMTCSQCNWKTMSLGALARHLSLEHSAPRVGVH